MVIYRNIGHFLYNILHQRLLFDDKKIKMARKSEEKQKENPWPNYYNFLELDDFLRKLSFPCCAAFSWKFIHFVSLPHPWSVFFSIVIIEYVYQYASFVPYVFNASSLCCLTDVHLYWFRNICRHILSHLVWRCGEPTSRKRFKIFTFRDYLTAIHCHHWISGITFELISSVLYRPQHWRWRLWWRT